MKTSPIILAIETATDACSAALVIGDTQLQRYALEPKQHTRLIIPMIESLLAEAELKITDLTAIAVGRGPGSFTGVRIAVSLAQGLAYGLGCPVYPISTLEALAWQIKDQLPTTGSHLIVPALDARMQEVYVAAYRLQHGVIIPQQQEVLCKPEAIGEYWDLTKDSVVTVGSGWDVYPNPSFQHFEQRYPHAIEIAQIAKLQMDAGMVGKHALDVLPVYLRDEVAKASA